MHARIFPRLFGKVPAVLIATVFSFGCAHSQKADNDKQDVSVPGDSPLAKIKTDMTQAEVEAILGPPAGTNSYVGGKAFNPFNFGGDTGRMVEAHYKGLGSVVYNVQRYSAEKKVDKVVYDPKDPGHN